MKDMTKEEFLSEVVSVLSADVNGYGAAKHDRAKAEAVFSAIDTVLCSNITLFPDVDGIRITDALRISIKLKPGKNFKWPGDGALQTSKPRYHAKLRLSKVLNTALSARRVK